MRHTFRVLGIRPGVSTLGEINRLPSSCRIVVRVRRSGDAPPAVNLPEFRLDVGTRGVSMRLSNLRGGILADDGLAILVTVTSMRGVILREHCPIVGPANGHDS